MYEVVENVSFLALPFFLKAVFRMSTQTSSLSLEVSYTAFEYTIGGCFHPL